MCQACDENAQPLTSGPEVTKMNPVVKAMWLEDLRSGNFEQGTGVLHRALNGEQSASDHTFCCLGVLSERAVAEGVCERVVHSDTGTFAGVFDYVDGDGYKEHHYLTPAVQEWAGTDSDPYLKINGRTQRVSQHNDEGATFEQIADAIEEQL